MAPPRQYRAPFSRFVWAALRGRQRSFAADASAAARRLAKHLTLHGETQIPREGAFLLVCNHYTRPGFGAWWIAILLSAAIAGRREPGTSAEVQWVTTAELRYPRGSWRSALISPASRWMLARFAEIYGFIPMAPMPPDPRETHARAGSVLQTVHAARLASMNGGILGLAPEGRDTPELVGTAVPGAGKFIAMLVRAGLEVLPAAVYESNGQIHVAFGSAFTPEIPRRRQELDAIVSAQVMRAIEAIIDADTRPKDDEVY